MPITSLKFTNLGPFQEAEFIFDPQINVFVGPNNTGKSTVLFFLAALMLRDYRPPRHDFRMPSKLFRSRTSSYTIRGRVKVGEISDEDRIYDQSEGVGPYRIDPHLFGYRGFVPAIRQNTDYRGEAGRSEMWPEKIPNAELARDTGVLQRIIDLDYRAYRDKSEGIREIVAKVFSTASAITDQFRIEYAGVGEDSSGLFIRVNTRDGSLPINCLSQGTQSLVHWVARVFLGYAEYYRYPDSYDDKPGILIIDEIDAHLHPSWQRRILPALTKEFPALQIFCSTHSPLMLAGLKAGQVHLLTRNEKGKVVVSRNETDIEGWSADEIMHTFLDVKSTTDLETQRRYDRLGELRAKDRLSPAQSKELSSLRAKVSETSSKTPAMTQVRAVADSLRQVVDKALGAGNGREAPTKKPPRRKAKPPGVKRSRPKAR